MSKANLVAILGIALMGCASEKGDAGPAGAQGASGPTGAAGAAGAEGAAGTMGASGPMGTAGTPGTNGTPGTMGAQGIPGPVDPTLPNQPTGLRFTVHPGAISEFDLHWELAGGGVPVSYFILYQSSLPIGANLTNASVEAVPGASRSAGVTLSVNSGSRYFAISAVSYTGKEGPLSEEYAVDTTSRLAIVSNLVDSGLRNLQLVSPGGGAPSAPLNGSFVTGQTVQTAYWSPTATRIAYVADVEVSVQKFELFVVGTAPSPSPVPVKVSGALVTGGWVITGNNKDPMWSPDGKQLAFIADKAIDKVNELWVVNANGGVEPTRLNTTMTMTSPTLQGVTRFAWSPDGKYIAYLANQDDPNVTDLYVVPAGGGANVKVSGGLIAGGNVTEFQWSFDGSYVGFVADKDIDETFELYVANKTGTTITKVSGPMVGGGNVSGLAWSPTANQLAFPAYKDEATTKEIYVVAATGGSVTKISGTAPPGTEINDGGWSPDGKHVALISTRNGFSELFVGTPGGGGGLTPIGGGTVDRDITKVRWSVDSNTLAYRHDSDASGSSLYELFTVRLDDRTPILLHAEIAAAPVTAQDTFAWSPDGTRIVFRGFTSSSSFNSLFTASALGGEVLTNVSATDPKNVNAFSWSPLGVSMPQ